METDIVQQYYKDVDTGVEMVFTKSREWGWAIHFPGGFKERRKFKGNIPWPKLTPEEQKIVDNNYEMLWGLIREEEE